MYQSYHVLPKSPDKARFSIGRAVESLAYGILIIPFAVVVCAIVAFAILPLHSDSRYDDGDEY
ncbi:hypothetical protein [Bradyrhizobium neotropicale]|uniref:Uncharacterized protein n=1 Tax=Bradyrhizobium neotropicale TaxID=1497615 RepID=A0A176YXP4_9BRAD|nr:hypothetical protein [Bradyrhizobium neotropicale]OAF11955.1 hypothetical protein AXW67_20370 [Bradyrhizobium neotropicale]